MEKTVLLLLALGLVTISECRSPRRKRGLSPSKESGEVCIEGLGCYPRGSTVVDATWVEPEMGNFITQLVEKTGIQVEDIHIIGHKLDVHLSGKRTEDGPRPMDCQEVMEAGHRETGVYEVWPKGGGTGGRPIRVRCDMDTDEGGWTVIQRRGNFSEQEDFNRDWEAYKNGFGDPSRDYWIGNDNIYAFSNQGAYSARFDMMDEAGNTAYELFGEFRIEDENSNYTLHIGNSSGTAGDCMVFLNGRMFSSKDRDNDEWNGNCAVKRKSGFWWKACAYCNLNGVYLPGSKKDSSVMYYNHWNRKGLEGLFAMEIKLKKIVKA